MTAVHTLIGTGIKTALSANASLVAMVGGNLFDTQPQAGLLSDFVVWHHMSGGDENVSATRSIDAQYLVIGESATHDNAELIAGYIDDALNGQTLSIPGWTTWGLTLGNLFSSTEDINGAAWYRRGGIYRIRIEQAL